MIFKDCFLLRILLQREHGHLFSPAPFSLLPSGDIILRKLPSFFLLFRSYLHEVFRQNEGLYHTFLFYTTGSM